MIYVVGGQNFDRVLFGRGEGQEKSCKYKSLLFLNTLKEILVTFFKWTANEKFLLHTRAHKIFVGGVRRGPGGLKF